MIVQQNLKNADHFDWFIGLDWSLSSPALIITDHYCFHSFFWLEKPLSTTQVSNFKFTQNSEKVLKGFDRVVQIDNWLAKSIKSIIQPNDTIFALFEGISYGSVGRVVQLAENLGVAKLQLTNNFNSVVHEVSPKSVKKFATGNGNSDKNEMYDSFYSKTNIQLTDLFEKSSKSKSPIQDIVDSYWIVQYAINNSERFVKDSINETK